MQMKTCCKQTTCYNLLYYNKLSNHKTTETLSELTWFIESNKTKCETLLNQIGLSCQTALTDLPQRDLPDALFLLTTSQPAGPRS